MCGGGRMSLCAAGRMSSCATGEDEFIIINNK